ncbi:hypothetical protein TRFO_24881 [Tritrichomonas foetus]|uniref:Uncharacterized protein n=1 Tax=Tritrichomonas foetus TaxID=1144522 RepID=A0A1J4K649_9EUKA|nr:hypothetical protein TRFO_24881 [Tritrichomonas foetus]|eukprot:OHT06929.1 hypothetical protein TRFO_24881 [Tritrichomonas foetus]
MSLPEALLKFMKLDKKDTQCTTEKEPTSIAPPVNDVNLKSIKLFPDQDLNSNNKNKNDNLANLNDSKPGKNQNNDEPTNNNNNNSKSIKKKKVQHDLPPDLEEKQNQKEPTFNYVKPKGVILDTKFRSKKNWDNNLISWFAHLRPSFFQLSMKNQNDVSLQSILKNIEKGEMPKTNEACQILEVEQILFYFERQNKPFSVTDLAWIFSALIFIDRLISEDVSSCLENLVTKMVKQVNLLDSPSDHLYPKLMVNITLITKFFHRQ